MAALSIHESLRKSGRDSQMLVARKYGGEEGIETIVRNRDISIAYNKLRGGISRTVLGLAGLGRQELSIACLPSALDRRINAYRADIVNIHWVQGEMISIEAMSRIDSKIVWTLHDGWPLLGARHIAKEEQVGDRRVADYLEEWCYKRKELLSKKVSALIAPSTAMKELALTSRLFRDKEIEVVGNPIDTELFRCEDRSIARETFGLNKEAFYVLFCGYYLGCSRNKGTQKFESLVSEMKERCQDIKFIAVGVEDNERKALLEHYGVVVLPRIRGKQRMARLYASSNVVLCLSEVESFGLIAAEAQACGRVVISSDTGGIRDIVDTGSTGYIECNLSSIASRIVNVYREDRLLAMMEPECRRIAEERWSQGSISERLSSFYSRIMGS